MQITKKEFSETMMDHYTYFLGITRKKRLSKDELFCKISDFLEKQDRTLLEQRTCRKKSTGLVFNNESHLDFAGSKYTCYKYIYGKNIILICSEKWYDPFDDEYMEKAMYYLLLDKIAR